MDFLTKYVFVDENYAIDHERTYVCRPLPHKISKPKQTSLFIYIYLIFLNDF